MTPDEQLEYERRIAEVLKIRSAGKKEESKVFAWLNSAFGLTMVGFVCTGILGALVTGMVQDRSKRNEMELQARKERSAARHEAMTKILGLLGAYVSSADDLVVIVNNAYSEAGRGKEEVRKLREWREKITTERDKADADWRREREGLGYTLQFLFENDERVSSAWGGVVEKADGFEACTNGWYTQNAAKGSNLKPAQVCPNERSALREAMTALTKAVSVNGSPYK